MSKKKGLSLEEKRSRMMEIFFDSKDVFQLKDLEKIAPKSKGITPMSVKEVLQSLVDDGLVDCERVGTSNYYWSFPSKALNSRQHQLDHLHKQMEEEKQRKVNLEKGLDESRRGREETEDRVSSLHQLQILRQQKTDLESELTSYRECDPEVVDETRKSNAVAKEAVSRWTDNVFAIKSWTKKKFSFDDARMDKVFGIPDDFDYMD